MEFQGKIVADCNIPYLRDILDPFAEVTYKKGDEITKADVTDASALIIRTRTKCNSELLEGSNVEFIATATIGTDHIDTDWCDTNGITVENAPGCNSEGVAEYVFSALEALKIEAGSTIGVIGAGHVGSKVIAMGKELGYAIFANDPYLCDSTLVDLDELLQNSDIVTLHIPLWECNRDFADSRFFRKMRDGAIFINASRGEVVCEDALKEAAPRLGGVVLDVWRNEPHIDTGLLERTAIATPHIAGYSLEGKRNATSMALRALAKHFGMTQLGKAVDRFDAGTVRKRYNPGCYDIMQDDAALRANPNNFESLRNNYKYR